MLAELIEISRRKALPLRQAASSRNSDIGVAKIAALCLNGRFSCCIAAHGRSSSDAATTNMKDEALPPLRSQQSVGLMLASDRF
jgi:hypothetical protein